jgi:thymidylate synthase (FAD)
MADIKHSRKLEVELISITPDAEKVIEEAGRTCYQSFDKMGDDTQCGFIERLIKMGHESPLEHAYATFRIKNCSCPGKYSARASR